ncbi:MAG: HD domain-containing protein [Bacteroidales bacterium]|nr:HD domain-containing protein [Bacteroidales bacterium]
MQRLVLLIIILLSLCSQAIKAQFSEVGRPFISNYSPKDYKHENQNFSIAQDTNGIMYFGNLDGIMQYDGQTWRYIEYPGKPQLASTRKGKIIAGGYQSFGIVENTENFKMVYRELSKSMEKAGYQFNHVNAIKTFGEKTVIIAKPQVFVIDSNLAVEHVLTYNNNIKLFGEKEPLLLLDSGLFKIDLERFDTVSCPCRLYNQIQNIIPFQDQYLVRFKDQSWKIFDQGFGYIRDFNNQASSILKNNKLVSSIYLSNGMFAFGTESCGIVIVDEEGRFVTHINQNNGLLDNDIYQLFEDSHHNIWVAMNNGIALLNYPSVFTIFDADYGIKGGVFDIIRQDGRIYIATSQGVLVSPDNQLSNNCQTISFSKIDGIKQKCRKFLKTNNRLFVSNSTGLYEIKGHSAEKLSDVFAFGLTASEEFKGYIYVAAQNGLYVYGIRNGFNLLGKIKNLDKDIRTVAETIDGDLWLGTNYEGVFFLSMSSGFTLNPQISQYKESNGLPKNHGWIDVFETHKGTYFSSFKGVFNFNDKTHQFEKQYLIDSLKNRWYYPISEDMHGNLWFSSGIAKEYRRQTGLRYYYAEKDSFVSVTQPFNQIRDYSIEVIYPDENSVIWFGSIEGLLRFDSKKMNRDNEVYQTKLRSVKFGKDSIIDPNIFKTKTILKLPYKWNTLVFQASTAYYQPQDEVLFQFRLEGLEEEWSNWQSTCTEQYSGLKEGDYTLFVRSKNIHDIISDPASFSFHIKPPYYRTWWAYLSYFILLGSFIYMIFRYRAYLYAKEKSELERIIRDKTEEIVLQKERAEDLVKNILPEDTARELQTKGRATRKKYELVTVLFSDIQGFTKIAEGLNPESLLDELDFYVLEFDKVVERFDIEKIKTIGDAYMCAGGIPKKNKTNPIDVVLAGLQMIHYAKKIQERSEFDWGIRFGVHTGPVIAGVVGSKKMSYDIWGDTVNIASRMESYGEVGHLNISETTYEIVSSYFECEYRGELPVKYKGNMAMYFVHGLKPEYCDDEDKINPNKKFMLKIQNIRFEELEDLILTKLEKGLDKRLYYHNVKHTIDVMNQVEVIGIGEGISDDEMILLKTAALFHDLGHTISFLDHEEQGIIFAKDLLPNFKYSDAQIEQISELIYATKFPPEPKNKLEEIICDADLDYLGRKDFLPVSNNLYLEMFEHGRINNRKEWNELQISFLKSHQYYTETARKAREVNKQEQLQKLIEQMERDSTKY